MADAFHTLLAGGGIHFDRRRFASDMQVFHPRSKQLHHPDATTPRSTSKKRRRDADSHADQTTTAAEAKASSSSSSSTPLALPRELDFFGSDASKRTSSFSATDKGKSRQGLDDAGSDGDGDAGSTTEHADAAHTPLTRSTLPAFLKRNQLKLTGTDVPLPLTRWDELASRFGVARWLLDNLASQGWKRPTPIQMAAIAIGLEKRDLLAGSPTGSGKTLAFLLPIVHHLSSSSSSASPARASKHDARGAPVAERSTRARGEGGTLLRAVVVSPTRELARQIEHQLRVLARGSALRVGVLGKALNQQRGGGGGGGDGGQQQDPASRKKLDVLVTTPLRLVKAIEGRELDLSTVRHLVLDEADRLLEQGFLAQTDAILSACTHASLRKSLFSATLPAGVEEMARTFLVDECRVLVGAKDAAASDVRQRLQFVGSEQGKLAALRELARRGELRPPVLVFVQSVERCRELHSELAYDDVLRVEALHASRTRAQRDELLDAFRRGDVWVLICTELMARGLDFRGVNLVVNYDFPQSVQSYVHRVGRTGRAGRSGEAVTFFTKEDAPYLRVVVNVMRRSGAEVPAWMLELRAPSQKQRHALKLRAPQRKRVSAAAATSVQGRRGSERRREMVLASQRREARGRRSAGDGRGDGDEGKEVQGPKKAREGRRGDRSTREVDGAEARRAKVGAK